MAYSLLEEGLKLLTLRVEGSCLSNVVKRPAWALAHTQVPTQMQAGGECSCLQHGVCGRPLLHELCLKSFRLNQLSVTCTSSKPRLYNGEGSLLRRQGADCTICHAW